MNKNTISSEPRANKIFYLATYPILLMVFSHSLISELRIIKNIHTLTVTKTVLIVMLLVIISLLTFEFLLGLKSYYKDSSRHSQKKEI